MNKKVSVIIPTYNRAHFIKSAIDSVLSQTYNDLELIVVDDGSTDETSEILAGYGDKFHYIQQNHQERSAARNKGIHFAKGEYIAFLDSDDVWLPDKLARQIPILDNALSNVVLVHGYKQVVDNTLKPLPGYEKKLRRLYSLAEKGKEKYESYLMSPCIFTSTVLVRRSALLEIGDYDVTINGREDLDLYLRLLLRGYSFVFIPEPPLIQYRLDENKTDRRKLNSSYLQVYKKHLGLCSSLKDKKKVTKARSLLYQNIAQTHYRLGDYFQSHIFWRKALKESWEGMANIHFWKQELVNYAKKGSKI